MKQDEFEDYVIKYLTKRKVVRFSDLQNWLSTVMKDPPAKATLSIKLDRMAKEGKIISWNEKGARYIALPCEHEELKSRIMNKMEDLSLKKDKVTIDELAEEIKLPKEMISQAITDLVSEGKIMNTTIDGVTYYKLPPIHASIKIGTAFTILMLVLYLIGEKAISKEALFVVALLIILIMTILWYKIR